MAHTRDEMQIVFIETRLHADETQLHADETQLHVDETQLHVDETGLQSTRAQPCLTCV